MNKVGTYLAAHADRQAIHSFPTRRSSDLHDARRSGDDDGGLTQSVDAAEPCNPWEVASELPQCGGEERFRPKHREKFQDRKSTRLNSSHSQISYAVFCLKKKRRAASYCS